MCEILIAEISPILLHISFPRVIQFKKLVKIMSSYVSELYEFDNYDQAESKFLTAFQRKVLVKNLQIDLASEYRRRIEIMLLADRGKTQIQICHLLGCSQHMARYWIGMAKSGLAHKWYEQPIGRPRSAISHISFSFKELGNATR